MLAGFVSTASPMIRRRLSVDLNNRVLAGSSAHTGSKPTWSLKRSWNNLHITPLAPRFTKARRLLLFGFFRFFLLAFQLFLLLFRCFLCRLFLSAEIASEKEIMFQGFHILIQPAGAAIQVDDGLLQVLSRLRVVQQYARGRLRIAELLINVCAHALQVLHSLVGALSRLIHTGHGAA